MKILHNVICVCGLSRIIPVMNLYEEHERIFEHICLIDKAVFCSGDVEFHASHTILSSCAMYSFTWNS